MTLSTVTWRQAVAAIAATVLTLFAVIVVVRSDGLPAVDAASARATGWFVHQPTGRVVLVDGYGGRALASLEAGLRANSCRSPRAVRAPSCSTTPPPRPGPSTRSNSVSARRSACRRSAPDAPCQVSGRPASSWSTRTRTRPTWCPADAEQISFAVEAGDATQVAPDGSIWSLVDGDLVRTTSTGRRTDSARRRRRTQC